jgi:hypothetical protein
MATEYEHKIHEMKLIEDPDSPDHPLIVQTRDNIHAADLKYAFEKGHLIGEPADLALNRDQLNWLKKFNNLQEKYYGQVYKSPPPVNTKEQLARQAAAEDNDSVFPAARAVIAEQVTVPHAAQAGPVTDLRDGWMAAVAAGETTEGFDQWASQRSVTGYLLPVLAQQTLMGMTTEMKIGDVVATIKQSILMAKPIYEVTS